MHRQARAFLRQNEELDEERQRMLSVAEARQMHELTLRNAGLPEPLADVSDRTVPGPYGYIPVRVYTPEQNDRAPLLVYFHGGGWVMGTLDTLDVPLRSIAKRSGCVVVSVDYRLAPEHKFPIPAEEAFAATAWVGSNASAVGADGTRVAVGGDSAGGNLAAVVAIMARDRDGPDLAAQVLIYPVTDHEFDTASYRECAKGYGLMRAAMRWVWDKYAAAEERDSPHASPLRAPDLTALPRAFVLTTEYDPLRDEGEAYAQRMRRSGVPVKLARYEGAIHGFLGHGESFDDSHRAVDEIAGFLREACGASEADDKAFIRKEGKL